MRLKLKEISPQRVLAAAIRRFMDIPHAIAWHTSLAAKTNRSRLESYRECHQRERCFIMGNGPSLVHMDLSLLKDEFTFGLNRIYLLFDRLSFVPTYYVSVNDLVLEQFASEIRALTMPKFLGWNQRSLFDREEGSVNFLRIALPLKDAFEGDITASLSGGGTVTYVAMQVAYFMGFEEVILVGVDHNFSDKGIPNQAVTRTAVQDKNHFDPQYFPKGSRWQLPDLYRSELAYTLAREAFEADNRHILDATAGGKCPVFEKVDFTSLF